MKYTKSEKYNDLMSKIMGPNPIKLTEELLQDCKILPGQKVCDLGSGMGLTSVFMAKEYGFTVYAADLWSDPAENAEFFRQQGLNGNRIIPVKADAENMPFEKEFFDALVCVDSYNYFGRNKEFLDKKLLPFLKSGSYIYLCITGMKKDLHRSLPKELLLSWSPEQLDYIHDIDYWTDIVSASDDSEIVDISEMESNEEVWHDWILQDNEYAVGDRAAINAGACKYLNFIRIVLRKR